MKKSERIKELESQVNYLQHENKDLMRCLESNSAAIPEPYFPKLTKTEAYYLTLEYCKVQPEQHMTLFTHMTFDPKSF
jgi:hypothetical protein